METLSLPENYRSVPSVVKASIAVLKTTRGGRLSVPQAMRKDDITPMFTTSPTFQVRKRPHVRHCSGLCAPHRRVHISMQTICDGSESNTRHCTVPGLLIHLSFCMRKTYIAARVSHAMTLDTPQHDSASKAATAHSR
jgi:hypothetical protein